MIAVLTGGGTAGHVTPNLALAEELAKRNIDCIYFGSDKGMERNLVKDIPYYALPAEKLRRSLSPKNLLLPFRVLSGIRTAEKLLKELKPDFVFGKGGYVSYAPCIAATRLGIPLFLHESDLTPGLVTRQTAKRAKLVFTSFPETKVPHAYFVGTPIRLAATVTEKRKKPKNAKPLLLVTGGSQGANRLNENLRRALPLLSDFSIVHLTGKGKLDPTQSAPHYHQVEYAEDMGSLYAKTDFALSRAGSNALHELLAAKIPTLLVPLSSGRGDQIENAAYYEKRGLVRVLSEQEMTPQLLAHALKNLLRDGELLQRNLNAAPHVNAACAIADAILAALS